MYYDNDWGLGIPLANEADSVGQLIALLRQVLDRLQSGRVYLVVDRATHDATWAVAETAIGPDPRFRLVWAPECRCVVDAYLRGIREAYEAGHEIILEMDGGLSHDPRAIPMFLRVLNEGNECAFGSRRLNGGSLTDSPLKRRLISETGAFLCRLLLGTRLSDMTSGFWGMHRPVAERLLQYPIHGTDHFYHPEVKYLTRKLRFVEVPIHYRAPSPRVTHQALSNALGGLLKYFGYRLRGGVVL